MGCIKNHVRWMMMGCLCGMRLQDMTIGSAKHDQNHGSAPCSDKRYGCRPKRSRYFQIIAMVFHTGFDERRLEVSLFVGVCQNHKWIINNIGIYRFNVHPQMVGLFFGFTSFPCHWFHVSPEFAMWFLSANQVATVMGSPSLLLHHRFCHEDCNSLHSPF